MAYPLGTVTQDGDKWREVITATGTWTAPTIASQGFTAVNIEVHCIGGGGGGGTAAALSVNGDGGGGGGGYSKLNSFTATPGNNYTATVGAGGTANGGTGGSTWFDATTTVLARGGVGTTVPAGGVGGATTAPAVGDVKFAGGNGGTGALGGGAGGGAAGTGGAGDAGGITTDVGVGTASYGSNGGAGGGAAGGAGTAGASSSTTGGGGGGGGGPVAGGAGAAGARGILVLRYNKAYAQSITDIMKGVAADLGQNRKITAHRTLSAIMVGVETVTKQLRAARTITAVMKGVAPTFQFKVGKIISARMDGVPTINRKITHTISATMKGIGTLTRKLTIHRTLSAIMLGRPERPVAFDSFDRDNNPTDLGVCSETGNLWVQLNGTWGIISNTAYTSVALGGSLAYIETGLADVTVHCSINIGTNPTFPGIAFRIADVNNYLFLQYNNGASLMQLIKNEAGVLTTLATSPASISSNSTIRFSLTARGNQIFCRLQGGSTPGVPFSHTLSAGDQTLYGSNTKHGLRQGSSITPRFNDFTVLTDGSPTKKVKKIVTATMLGVSSITRRTGKIISAIMIGVPVLNRRIEAHRTLTGIMLGVGTVNKKPLKLLFAVMKGVPFLARFLRAARTLFAVMHGVYRFQLKLDTYIIDRLSGGGTTIIKKITHLFED